MATVESQMRESERALSAVNQAIGAEREQLTKATTDLIAVESEIYKIATVGKDLRDLQIRVDQWIDKTQVAEVAPLHAFDPAAAPI